MHGEDIQVFKTKLISLIAHVTIVRVFPKVATAI